MIKTRTSLYSTKTTIDRIVEIKAMDNIKKYLGFYNRDIYYKLDEENIVGNTKDKLGRLEDLNSKGDEYMSLTYETKIVDDYELSLKNINPDYFPIYRDKDINSRITPIYANTEYNMVINYYSKSKARVDAAIDRLRLNPSSSNWETISDIEYSFILPGYCLDLLIHINDLKNLRLTTPIDFNSYINNTFDDRVDMVNAEDANTDKADVAIREKQLGVRGYVTTDLSNINAEFEESQNRWKITIEYKLVMEKPISLLMQYPILIWNSLIDKKFRIDDSDKAEYSYKPRTLGSEGLQTIAGSKISEYLTPPKNSYHLTIPKEDRFKAEKPDAFLVRILSVLCVVDTENPTMLFNINDIPKIKFKDKIIDFMKFDYQHLHRPYDSIFYIELLKDGEKDYHNEIIIDENLNMTTKYPMDVRSIYRVMFNANKDLNLLNGKRLSEIANYVKEEQKLIPENEVVPLVDYFLDLFNIEGLPNTDTVLKHRDCDIKYLLVLNNNPWATMRTVQTTRVFSGVLEER